MDGTLLNHFDYAYADALPMIAYLKSLHVPVVLTTSKTRIEVVEWQQKLGLHDAFIIENGAGVCVPERDSFRSIGHFRSYENILGTAEEIKAEFPVECFSDMPIERLMELTNMDEIKASKAKMREFSEPFFYEGDTLPAKICDIAESGGLKILKGGRFYHLIDKRADKGVALKMVVDYFGKLFQTEIKTVALGDSPNDFDMLKIADTPILMPHHDGRHEPLDIPRLIRADHHGCRGWAETLRRIDFET